MKKLLAILLALVASLCLMTSCLSDSSESGSEQESKIESEVESEVNSAPESEVESTPESEVEPSVIETPTSIALSSEGVITFEGQDETLKCKLYVNGAFCAEITSGQNIYEYLTVGENSIQLELCEKEGELVSEKSAALVKTKLATITEYAINVEEGVFTLSFTAENDCLVDLYAYDELVASGISSGYDITSFIADGLNEFALVAVKADCVNSDMATMAYTLHPTLNDVAVSTAGIISFTEYHGYTYSLYVNDSKVGEVKSGDSILNHFANGTNEIKIEIVGSALLGVKEQFSSAVSIEKLVAPAFTIDKAVISFDAVDGAEYELFVDGEKIGTTTSGSSLASLFQTVGNFEVQIKPVAVAEGFVDGDISTTVTYTIGKYDIPAIVTDFATKEVNVNGVDALQVVNEQYGFTIDREYFHTRPVDLLAMKGETLIELSSFGCSAWNAGATLTIWITDVDNADNKLGVILYGNADSYNAGSVYVQFYQNGQWTYTSNLNENYGPNGKYGPWVMPSCNFGQGGKFTLRFDAEQNQFIFADNNLVEQLEEVQGFENGAIISVCATGWVYDVNGVTVSKLEGLDYIPTRGFTPVTRYDVTKAESEAFTIDGQDKVIEGFDYSFTVTVGGRYEGTPIVTVNGNEVIAVDGVYIVENVNENLSIDVTGLTLKVEPFVITVNKSENVVFTGANECLPTENYSFSVEVPENYTVTIYANDKVVSTGVSGDYDIGLLESDTTIKIVSYHTISGNVVNGQQVANVQNGEIVAGTQLVSSGSWNYDWQTGTVAGTFDLVDGENVLIKGIGTGATWGLAGIMIQITDVTTGDVLTIGCLSRWYVDGNTQPHIHKATVSLTNAVGEVKFSYENASGADGWKSNLSNMAMSDAGFYEETPTIIFDTTTGQISIGSTVLCTIDLSALSSDGHTFGADGVTAVVGMVSTTADGALIVDTVCNEKRA